MIQKNLSSTADRVTALTFVQSLDEIYDLEKNLVIDKLYTKRNNAYIYKTYPWQKCLNGSSLGFTCIRLKLTIMFNQCGNT